MKAIIEKLPGCRGFIGTTYAVWQGSRLLKIFKTRQEAHEYADKVNAQEDQDA